MLTHFDHNALIQLSLFGFFLTRIIGLFVGLVPVVLSLFTFFFLLLHRLRAQDYFQDFVLRFLK